MLCSLIFLYSGILLTSSFSVPLTTSLDLGPPEKTNQLYGGGGGESGNFDLNPRGDIRELGYADERVRQSRQSNRQHYFSADQFQVTGVLRMVPMAPDARWCNQTLVHYYVNHCGGNALLYARARREAHSFGSANPNVVQALLSDATVWKRSTSDGTLQLVQQCCVSQWPECKPESVTQWLQHWCSKIGAQLALANQ